MKLFFPSKRRQLIETIPIFEQGIVFNGDDIKSYAWMINQCLSQCKDEDVAVICSDRCRPEQEDLDKLLSLINQGYGVVGLYRFGFYGIHMDVVRRIGPLDERYILGTYEDADYLRRVKEANIAYYESEEVTYCYFPSFFDTHNTLKAIEHFKNKWNHDTETETCTRLLLEENYNYDFGNDSGKIFLPWSESILCKLSGNFKNWKMK